MRRLWDWYQRFLLVLVTTLAAITDIALPIVVGWFVADRVSLGVGIAAGLVLALILIPAGVAGVVSARSMLRQGIA
jgi:hypothetical protein